MNKPFIHGLSNDREEVERPGCRRITGRWTLLLIAALAMGVSPMLSAETVTGLITDGVYATGSLDDLCQWKIGKKADGSDSAYLGKVDLDVVLGWEFTFGQTQGSDIAVLSDRRIALAHRDSANTKYQVSVFTLGYDGGSSLTGATCDVTFDQAPATQGARIAPLPKEGFVIAANNAAAIYFKSGINVWTNTTVAAVAGGVVDAAGLIDPTRLSPDAFDRQFVTGEYDRMAHKYNESGSLAKYNGPTGTTDRVWGYDNEAAGEGLRNELLANGWVVEGQLSQGAESEIMDGMQTDGLSHNGVVGYLMDSSTNHIYDHIWAGLGDGRVAGLWYGASGVNRVTFKIFTLKLNPAGQPPGSIGATGEDFTVAKSGPNPRGMRIAGDYMIPPPPKGTVVWFK